jgi:hypothetical protein
LKARLDKVLGNKASAPKKSEDSMPSKPAPKMESKKASVTEDEVPWKSEETDEEDDSLDFFRKLAEE